MNRSCFASLAAWTFVAIALGCSSRPPLPPKALALNEEAAAALANGDLDAAAARLHVAIEYSPRFVEAWTNLGLLELRRGNLDLAHKHLAKARSLNADLPAPHHGLGLLADRRGLGDEAEKHYRHALRVDPGFGPARVNLARRFYERRAFDEAREQFLRLTQVAPEQLEGWTGLAECLFRLEREVEADEVIAQTRARFGDVPEVRLLVARQALRRGAWAEAERTLEPLTDDADRSREGTAWAWMAVARLARGDRAGALHAAAQAQAIRRDDPIAALVVSSAVVP
jgi:tetratricopeptide (TPR) repeat protein